VQERVTLFAVRLEAVREAWTHEAVAEHMRRVPRGRMAALCGAPATPPFDKLDATDRAQPPANLLLSLGPARARLLWDALCEDGASAALYDAPALVLADVLATVAKLAQKPSFDTMRLDHAAEPAYPPELLEPPGASGPISVGGRITYKVWMGAAEAAVARAALARALSLPAGAFPAQDAEMWREVGEGLLPVLDAAARARHSLLAGR
jgi:hypothetical protein